jgi:uncharacterized protein
MATTQRLAGEPGIKNRRIADWIFGGKLVSMLANRLGLRNGLRSIHFTVDCPGLLGNGQKPRVVFASDFHAGSLTEDSLLDCFDRIQKAKPHLVLLGGDFVSSEKEQVTHLLPYFKALQREVPCGLYAVLGDHDIRCGGDYVRDQLRSAGIILLENATLQLPVPFSPVRLQGLSMEVGRNNGGEEMEWNDEVAQLVFMHSPALLRTLRERKFLVAFAGHTHGGQIALPGGIPLFVPGGRLCRRYSSGRFDLGANRVFFVSRGIGCSLLPFRLFSPPDILICDLVGLEPGPRKG